MSRGVNKVMIVGNLGQDPEVRSTAQGTQVANLNIATDESYKDRQTGETVSKTEWHRVVLFGRTAEVAAQYLNKGSKVYMEGRLQTRKWTDKNNIDRYTTEIVVAKGGQMLMLDGGGSVMGDSSIGDFPIPATDLKTKNPIPNEGSEAWGVNDDEVIPFDDELPF